MVAYAASAGEKTPVQVFEIEQLVAPGEVAARPLLPSLRYHPAPEELSDSAIRLPWIEPDPGAVPNVVLGELARELGARTPGRLVASAKSWLSHPAVDRTAPILPWGGVEGVAKVSPVDASASYLAHVRAAWNQRFPDHPLEQQEVVLTVPASFDEAARALTLTAARRAGLEQVRLLEEPQAACYDWLHRHHDDLLDALSDSRLLLVCDVGGGTTDLTLIRMAPGEDGPRFTRIGVGDHLMLGGDNMDLTLAHRIEQRLGGERLSAAALSQLIQQCRAAKERLLTPLAPERATVTLLGAGARLIGGARAAELSRDEVRELVVDGFLPRVGLDEWPQKRRAAIVEFGLPYAADAAISRHLAAFLGRHATVAREALGEAATAPLPDAVLLNGGVFQSQALSERLLEILADWRGQPARRFDNPEPMLAVARGAVAYGMARRGQGLRIGGGSARSYFLIVEGEARQKRGVCLLPKGAEEDREIRLRERTFSLRLGEPVRFHLVSSSGDQLYQPGELVDIDYETFATLPPIATVLDGGGGTTPVQLATTLTEVGALELSCVAVDDPARRWQLAFQLRGEEAALAATPHPRFREAAEWIDRFYGPRSKAVEPRAIKNLRLELERILGRRDGWDTPLLRSLFDLLWEGARRRRRSADHERIWFSLAGYCLRPGFGYPLDDWRSRRLWSIYVQGVQHGSEAQIWSEWWILWRRVAGGLDEAAQTRLLTDVEGALKPVAERLQKGAKGKPGGRPGYDDIVRLAASLERLPAARKVEVGNWLLTRLSKKGESPQSWLAVGRLGGRVPLYGGAHNVAPRDVAAAWLEQLLQLDWKTVEPAAFAATLLARLSGDRERDLPEELRRRTAQKLRTMRAPETWIRMVETVVELDEADEKRIFGESLPPGLRLAS